MNQVYLPGNTTLQIQQAINRLLSIIGSSKTGSGVFIWTLTKTWQTLYDEIQASGGAGIVLVETDGSTNREMTDNGGNPTDLGGLYFIGLAHHSGAYPAINIDSAGGINGLFNLGGNHVILSKNIHWSIYHRIGNDQNFDLQLDGGSWYQITVINDILDFTMIEAGTLEIENVVFSLDKLMENVTPSAAVAD